MLEIISNFRYVNYLKKNKKIPYAFNELDNQSTLLLKLKMSLTSEGVEASNPFGASEL